MREDLEELNSRELFHYPVILGGAALTRKYVEDDLRRVYKGNVYYAQDAFEGLATLEKVVPLAREGKPLPVLTRGGAEVVANDGVYDPVLVAPGGSGKDDARLNEYARSDVSRGVTIPNPPFWGSRVVRGIPLRDIFPWINEVTLFRGQWQYQRGERTDADYAKFVDEEVRPIFRRWQESAISEQLLVPQVVYGYFPALADKNALICWSGFENGKPVGEPVRLEFPRQSAGRRLCIADFFRSVEEAETGGPAFDVVGMSLVTMGPRASDFAKELFEANEYRDYLHWHGFSVESAEGLAEMWHARMRAELGISDKDGPTHRELFQQHYQGARYSFGYPACPDLEEQTKMAVLLQPDRIGVELSETFQWHPEQSTSAVVVHHPEARYFVVK
jgi:5-methyltetrahydrofolate--homocysteine methyltransferase